MAAPTDRARQLESLANSLPGANQKVQTGLQEARKTQLQATLQGMAPSQSGIQAAQALGQQQAQMAGQINTQGQQKAQTQQVQLGQLGLQDKASQQRGKAFQQQLGLNEKQQAMASKLNKIDSQLKNRLLDQQLDFRKDQAGQTLMNETQLMDWALTKATSAEELKDYMQASQQVYDRKNQMTQMAYKVIADAAETGYLKNKKQLDRQSQQKLVALKREAEKSFQQQQADARNKAARNGALGTILGMAAGAGIAVATGGASVGISTILGAAGAGGAIAPALGTVFGVGE
jgi:hypothetical protein